MNLDWLEARLRRGEFAAVDEALDRIVVTDFKPATLVGMVTLTRYATKHLTRREDFLRRVEAHLTQLLGKQRTTQLLAARR